MSDLLEKVRKGLEAVPGDDGEMPAHLVPRELLVKTFGHGWQETHFIGDDEDPEQVAMMECVWIKGHITNEEGSHGEADSDYWREHYGKRYGIRVWTGSKPPTEEQRKETPWSDLPMEKPADPTDGKYSGLIAEE